jgi:hypothetical protein
MQVEVWNCPERRYGGNEGQGNAEDGSCFSRRSELQCCPAQSTLALRCFQSLKASVVQYRIVVNLLRLGPCLGHDPLHLIVLIVIRVCFCTEGYGPHTHQLW